MDDSLNVTQVKLGDFGLCAKLDNHFSSKLMHRCGTWGYMAPEQLRRQQYNEVRLVLTETVDMYGLAMVTYVLFFGHHPFIENVDGVKKVSNFRQLTADWRFPGGVCPR